MPCGRAAAIGCAATVAFTWRYLVEYIEKVTATPDSYDLNAVRILVLIAANWDDSVSETSRVIVRDLAHPHFLSQGYNKPPPALPYRLRHGQSRAP